jgi:Carboxypeptidase regulatory-like domain
MGSICRAAMLTVSFALIAYSQVERASIVGTLRDPSGSVVPGVTVRVVNEGTNTTTTLTTDAAGEYSASNLTPGNYTIEAEKSGFTRRVYRNFTVQVAQVARLDITLEVGAVEQTVEVTTQAPLLQTENASVGQVISERPIAELPLNGRNFAQLAVLAPGVTGLSYAQTATINAGARPDELRPGGTTIEANGARDSSNQLLIDGVDNTEMISQTFVVRPAVDGLQEFKVLTNNAGAEFGRAGGAVVITSTKSGTNVFHGSLFEFLRNSALDAKNYFDRKDAPIPPYKLNDFGGTIGGPVLRNRTFFFVDYEGTRERLGQTIVVTVPTAAMKAGNFQGIAPNGIFDPTSTRASGTTNIRDRFQNDIIPANRFDPFAAKIVALYPNPQTSALANNFVANPVKRSTTDRGDVRIDHQISGNQNLFARYSADSARLFVPDTFNTQIGGNENAFAGPDDILGQNMALGYNRIISPTVVAEYRFGLTKFKNFLLPTTLTDPVWKTIPGRENSDPFQPSAPIISPSGFAGLGNSRSDPLIRREHMIENMGDIVWQKGSHNFKFGVDIRHREISETASPPGQSAFGRFNFDSSFTNNPALPGGTGNAIASMLLGYPSSTVRDLFIPGTAHVFTNELNFYGRDEWRVKKFLTLNLGLHYEINTPFHESNNFWVNFDPVTGKQLIAGQNGVSSTANWRTDYASFGPRAGFAYQLSNKTVIRGGYGIFYDPQGNQGTTIRQERQFPFDLIYTLSPGSLIPGNTVSQGFITLAQIQPLNLNSPFGSLKAIAPDFRNASIQQFNLGVQRQLTASTVLTVTYVGTLGRHLTWALPLDQPAPGPGNIQARRPYNAQLPNVTAISYLESAGNSEFQSLQTVFEKRFSHGLFFNANWVWSHSMDNAPYDGGADGPIPQDPTNRRADWASSNNDVRHRLNIWSTYELPLGPGKPWLNGTSAFNRYVIGGWQVDGIAVLQSGLPFTVTTASGPTNTGAGGRADVVPGVARYPSNPYVNLWFNPAAFTTPQPFNWGNAGRNILNGPRAANFDFTAEKKFLFSEARQLWFRAEFFNAFNHPQFSIPASTIGATGVGTISSTARPSRQIQFALKLLF